MTGPDSGIDPVSIVAGAANALPAGVGFKGAVDLLVLLTVLSLAPAILMLCTCFTRVVVVLGLLRQAVGAQAEPEARVPRQFIWQEHHPVNKAAAPRHHDRLQRKIDNGRRRADSGHPAKDLPYRVAAVEVPSEDVGDAVAM